MEQNKQKYISFITIILVVALGVFLALQGEKANNLSPGTGVFSELKDDINTEAENPDKNTTITPEKTEAKPNTDNAQTNLTKEQKELLAKLQTAADARNFESFAEALLEVYKNQWSGIEDFKKVESGFYVYATDTYWVKGDLENSLKVSTIVYDKVPEAWRFRYLRIVALEKYGRNAFDAGDLAKAENYANQILRMMYRLEGANLLADIYIKKTEDAIAIKNKKAAEDAIAYIWDYEISQDRREKLIILKEQTSKL